jgi:hypothetical protein
MRKIEKQMLQAIVDGKNWHNTNTSVCMIDDNNCAVYLHGNEIAIVNTGNGFVMPNRITFRNWPTPTTRSRLSALGVRANIKNFRAQIDGVTL